MWPFKTKFERGLANQAHGMILQNQDETEGEEEGTMSSIDIDVNGFYGVDPMKLGRLCGLIFAQAQLEGVTRVQLYYGKHRMVYTIHGTDHEMVCCPSPMQVDMARFIVAASQTSRHTPGTLRVVFADVVLDLAVTHGNDTDDPYIEITGFTGCPRTKRQCA